MMVMMMTMIIVAVFVINQCDDTMFMILVLVSCIGIDYTFHV